MSDFSGTVLSRSKQQKLKKLITTLKEERARLDAKIDKLSDKLMSKCPHPMEAIREGRGTPPMRVCIDCGYAEEGWGCGFWKLRKDYGFHPPEFLRDEAFKYVRKFWTQDKLSDVRYGVRSE